MPQEDTDKREQSQPRSTEQDWLRRWRKLSMPQRITVVEAATAQWGEAARRMDTATERHNEGKHWVEFISTRSDTTHRHWQVRAAVTTVDKLRNDGLCAGSWNDARFVPATGALVEWLLSHPELERESARGSDEAVTADDAALLYSLRLTKRPTSGRIERGRIGERTKAHYTLFSKLKSAARSLARVKLAEIVQLAARVEHDEQSAEREADAEVRRAAKHECVKSHVARADAWRKRSCDVDGVRDLVDAYSELVALLAREGGGS